MAGALEAAGVNQPAQTKTMASLGVSTAHWCAPVDAGDDVVTVDATVEILDGRQALKTSTMKVESFATGSKKSFKDAHELGDFLKTYYRQPNPARLLPALQFLVADQTQHPTPGQADILAAFLSAAVKADSVAAQDLQTRIGSQPPLTRAFGLLVLRSAGYDISGVLNKLSADDKEKFLSLPQLQDPFDLSPTEALFTHLDMLWAVFGATGQFEPVKAIASALNWRTDYEDFDKLRKSPNHPSTLTPSLVRGVVYMAAGWSLASFQREDPLVADYIDYMRASKDIAQSIKSELGGLWRNPAFRRPGAK